MKFTAAVLLVAMSAVPLGAQGQGRARGGAGVPPGQMPPPGLCRVWYDGRPPGRQPSPVACREAERIVSRTRAARVVYGADDRYRYDRYDPRNTDPRYNDSRYSDPRDNDRFSGYDERDAAYWDPARDYRRNDNRYAARRLGRSDRIYRGTDNRYYCRRDDGTTGLIIGGISGGVLGNIIARGGSKALGTIIGAAAGAAIGKAVDDGDIVCR